MKDNPPKSIDERDVYSLRIKGLPGASHFTKRGSVVLTFGVFDGVTRAQQAILKQVARQAELLGAPSAVVIFRPRPYDSFEGRSPRPYLTATPETVRLIKGLGIRYVGILRFDRELADTRGKRFLRRLMLRIPFRELWLGAGATVGRGSEGTLSSVQEFGEELGFTLKVFKPAMALPGTTEVLKDLESRDIAAATRGLGRPYRLSVYVGLMDPLKERNLARYEVVTPDLLYVPPDGGYAVMVRPPSSGTLRVREDSFPGHGALTVRTERLYSSNPKLHLIGKPTLGWEHSAADLEFLAALPGGSGPNSSGPSTCLWTCSTSKNAYSRHFDE